MPRTTCVPDDIAHAVLMRCGAVGSCPGAVVTLAPYPESNRFWVRVEWLWTGGVPNCDRTFAPGELMWHLLVTLAVNECRAGDLIWTPDLDVAESRVNPFTGGGS